MTADDTIYEAEGYMDEDLREADIVEWYEARPVTVPTAVAAGAIVTAFTLGALTAVGALFLIGRYHITRAGHEANLRALAARVQPAE